MEVVNRFKGEIVRKEIKKDTDTIINHAKLSTTEERLTAIEKILGLK